MESEVDLCGYGRQPTVQKKDEIHSGDPAQACKKTMNIAGRKEEIGTGRLHIRRRHSMHINGPEGVGRSTFIDYVYPTRFEIGASPKPMY